MKVSRLVVVVLVQLNVAVTPAGTPDVRRSTSLAKPFCLATAMVLFWAEPPTSSVRSLAVDEMVKFGVGMVSAMVVELVTLPDAPVTFTG